MMTTTLTTKTRRHEESTRRRNIFFFVLPSCSSCFRGVGSVLACLLWLSLGSSAFAATKAIRAGRAIDAGGKVITNAVILVDGDRITSIGTAAPPAGAG